jgi:hypothetical protein
MHALFLLDCSWSFKKKPFRQSNDSRLHKSHNSVVTFGLLVRKKRSSTRARYNSDGPYVRHVREDEEQSVWKDATRCRHKRLGITALFNLSVRSLRSTVSRQRELRCSLNFWLEWFPAHWRGMIQSNPLSARQSSRAAQWCLHNGAMRSVYCSQYRQHVVSVSRDWRWMVMDYVLD